MRERGTQKNLYASHLEKKPGDRAVLHWFSSQVINDCDRHRLIR